MSNERDYPDAADDWCERPDDDDGMEAVGSCAICGINLYEDDDPDFCDQCLFGVGIPRKEARP